MHAHIGCIGCACMLLEPSTYTEVFRLVDTKFANSAELNSCSQTLGALHLYDSIFARLNLSCTCANSTGQPT